MYAGDKNETFETHSQEIGIHVTNHDILFVLFVLVMSLSKRINCGNVSKIFLTFRHEEEFHFAIIGKPNDSPIKVATRY